MTGCTLLEVEPARLAFNAATQELTYNGGLRVDKQVESAPRRSKFSEIPMKKTGYESDLTKFMREFLDRHPAVAEKQKQARATWWDKPEALEDLKRDQESKVPLAGYAYYDKP